MTDFDPIAPTDSGLPQDDGPPAPVRFAGRPPAVVWRVVSIPFLLFATVSILSLASYHSADVPWVCAPPTPVAVNWMGRAGAFLGYALLLTFGLPAFLVPLFAAALGLPMLLGRHVRWRPLWALLLLLDLCALAQHLSEPLASVLASPRFNLAPNAGGGIGCLLAHPQMPVVQWLGAGGATVVYGVLAAVFALLFVGPGFLFRAWAERRERREALLREAEERAIDARSELEADDSSAEEARELAEHRDVLGAPHAAPADDEHLRLLDPLLRGLGAAAENLDRRGELLRRERVAHDAAARLDLRRNGEDLVAHRGELRAVARRVDVRHDVAAVGRADLVEVRRLRHAERRAVRREARAEARRDARRERAAAGRAADEDGRGLRRAEEVLEGVGEGLDAEVPERGVLVDVDLVRAVRQQRLDRGRRVRADRHGEDRLGGLRRQFSRLAEQLQPDRVQRALGGDLRHDRDAAPERLVDAGRGVLDELEDVGGSTRARAAHAAARADGEGAGGVLLDRAEGAERPGGGLVGDLLVVDDDAAHRRNFLSSRRSASASACAAASPSSIVRSARASGGKMRFTCVGEPLRP